jgi:hypothetical protein
MAMWQTFDVLDVPVDTAMCGQQQDGVVNNVAWWKMEAGRHSSLLRVDV